MASRRPFCWQERKHKRGTPLDQWNGEAGSIGLEKNVILASKMVHKDGWRREQSPHCQSRMKEAGDQRGFFLPLPGLFTRRRPNDPAVRCSVRHFSLDFARQYTEIYNRSTLNVYLRRGGLRRANCLALTREISCLLMCPIFAQISGTVLDRNQNS